MTKLLSIMLVLLAFFPAYGGTYNGLTPGRSTRQDTVLKLGMPVNEYGEGETCDYSPPALDIIRISITFDRIEDTISRIDIYPRDSYSKWQYQAWLGLGKPTNTMIEQSCNLVENYLPEGISLRYAGPDDSHPVLVFSHFDPQLQGKKPQIYYEKAAVAAFYDSKDFSHLEEIVGEGLRIYPDSPLLWTFRAKYYYFNPLENSTDRNWIALQSAKKALELAPSHPKNWVDVGWLYENAFEDYRSALCHYQMGHSYGEENPTLYYRIAICYEALCDHTLAIIYYDRFLDAA